MSTLPKNLIIHPVPAEQQEILNEIKGILAAKGYDVVHMGEGWVKVSKGDVTVQLEVDNPGANLDIVLLTDEADDYDTPFPLGGSWMPSSTVKLVEGNVNFAVARVQAFFGVVAEDDDMNARVWEMIQRRNSGF